MAEQYLLHELYTDNDNALPFDYFLTEDVLRDQQLSTRPVEDSDLYKDRLDSFIDRQRRDIEAFAAKEGRPFQEVRLLVSSLSKLATAHRFVRHLRCTTPTSSLRMVSQT